MRFALLLGVIVAGSVTIETGGKSANEHIVREGVEEYHCGDSRGRVQARPIKWNP